MATPSLIIQCTMEPTGAKTGQPCLLLLFRLTMDHLAVDDTYNMDEDSEINGNIISNDISAMDSLVVVGINIGGIEYTVGDTILIPDVGRIIIKENGDFVFYPDTNFDSEVPIITYTVNDGNGGYDSAKISIKIQSKNDNPIVFNEFYKICIGSVLEGNVLSNGDYDPEGRGLDRCSTILLKGPLYGDFSIEPDGSFEYASFGDQDGETDTIIVSICENVVDGLCTNDTIIIQLPMAVELNVGDDISICGTDPVHLDNTVATGAITLRWTTSGDGVFSDSSLVNPVYIARACRSGKPKRTIDIGRVWRSDLWRCFRYPNDKLCRRGTS